MLRRRFLLGSAAIGLLAGGGLFYRRWRSGEEPIVAEYAGAAATLDDVADGARFDVCIVGSGPAGAVVARELAKSGGRVLIVETGLAQAQLARLRTKPVLNDFRSRGPIEYPLRASRIFGPGGTTAVWTGRCPRLLPIDFEPNAYTPAGTEWPLSYADLVPYYAEAERLLQVAGDPEAERPLRDGEPFPAPSGGGNEDVKPLLRRVGVEGFDSPTSTAPAGGPVRVARDLLPSVADAGTLLLGVSAHRLILAPGGKHVSSVLLRDLDGRTRTIHAKAIVLAAGGVESARRLLLCRSEAHPNGLGNSSGLVGRCFADHPNVAFTGSVLAAMAPGARPGQMLRSFQFYEPFKKAGVGSIILVASLWREGGHGARKAWSGGLAQCKLGLAATLEMLPVESNRIALTSDPAAQDSHGDALPELHFGYSTADESTFEKARNLIRDLYARLGASAVSELPLAWSHHHLGTSRMGSDPRTSVVNRDLALHDAHNVYVLSSGSFVTGGASNPTLLIAALATRLGRHLTERLPALG